MRALPFGPIGPFIPAIATALVRSLGRTCNLVEVRDEAWCANRLLGEKKNVIFALWHNRILYALYYWARRFHAKGVPYSLLVSASKDGELLARTIQYMRADVVRGSSSRGGREALLGLLDRLEKGFTCWVTPDGPRGPRCTAHPGVTLLAQKSQVPIVPVTIGARRAFVFRSWDRFVMPLPCSPVRVLYGQPMWIPAGADDAMREHFRLRLEDELNALTAEADDWRTLRRGSWERPRPVPETPPR